MNVGYELGKGKGCINHLLFMDDLKLYGKNMKQLDTLINTVRIFSNDIGMKFGLQKCGVLIMKKGKYGSINVVKMPDNEEIKEIDKDRGYKYLGVLEADKIKDKEMKEKIQKEYFRRVRRILKSKLNSGNTILATNSRAVSLIRYGAGIISWTKSELQKIDRKTRKLMTVYRGFHKQGDIDRLYFKRSQGGRGMISVEDCVSIEVSNLRNYVEQSQERLLIIVRQEEILGEGKEKKVIQNMHKESYNQKVLHGQFYKNTEKVRDPLTWDWLKKGYLKKETEGMIMAAQDQALRTRYIRKEIDKEDISAECRLCNERNETVSHIVSECKMLAQNHYKNWRHDKIAQILHWKLCQLYCFDCSEKWYEHEIEKVLENDDVKILWDFKIQTDKVLEHSRPDITIHKKAKKECILVDVACPFDTRVKEKEEEKIAKYQDLKYEIKRIWQCCRVEVIPVIIGALGTVTKRLSSWLEVIGTIDIFNFMQKACLLGSARILRYVLDT